MKEEQNDSDLFNLTIKKVTGEAEEKDLSRLESLLSESKSNLKLHDEIVKTWEASKKGKGITKEETQEEWVRLKLAISEKKATTKTLPLLRIAASIILVLVAGWSIFYFLKNDQSQIVTKEIHTKTLEDGSTITLNVGSTLSYEFTDDNRNVFLSGEAFFEVQKDPVRPFNIKTSSLDIEVLGTSFNVKSRESLPTTEVTVVTGIVEVTFSDKAIKLGAGEKGVWNKKSGQLFKIASDDPNFLSWKTKKFVFMDTPLSEVIETLNSSYQSNIYLGTDVIADCLITVSFDDQSLEMILKVLEATLDMESKETDRGIQLTGTGC